jgi:ankyrin repeat protein
VDQAVLLAGLVHQRRHDTLARLLRAGADPGAADYDGHTALHVAAAMGGWWERRGRAGRVGSVVGLFG